MRFGNAVALAALVVTVGCMTACETSAHVISTRAVVADFRAAGIRSVVSYSEDRLFAQARRAGLCTGRNAIPCSDDHTYGIYDEPQLSLSDALGFLDWQSDGHLVVVRFPSVSSAAKAVSAYRRLNPNLSSTEKVTLICNLLIGYSPTQGFGGATKREYERLAVRLRDDC